MTKNGEEPAIQWCGVSVDFKQAYDSVPRKKLWEIVHQTAKTRGIRDEIILCKLIEELFDHTNLSYGNRMQRINKGIPQGSKLGPDLFAFFLTFALGTSQKLSKLSKSGRILAFADDLVICCDSPRDVEDTLAALTNMEQFGLTMNVNKTKVLTNTDTIKERKSFKYTDSRNNSHDIEAVEEISYLGISVCNTISKTISEANQNLAV